MLPQFHHMHDLPHDFHVAYTARWRTTGTSRPDPGWKRVFRPFTIRREIMELSPVAVFMHDLPAHRGEVTGEVLDGPASIAFDQARCKMLSAMAVLEWCIADTAEV